MRRVLTFSIGLVAVLTAAASAAAPPADDLTGMPPLLDPQDVYAAARPGRLSPNVKGFPDLIYVPNSVRDTVQVIDPHTFKVIDEFAVGRQPQHVVPSNSQAAIRKRPFGEKSM